jgi:hypothetical protein
MSVNSWGVSWGVSWDISWGGGPDPVPVIPQTSSGGGKGKFNTANDNKAKLDKSRKRYVETLNKITADKDVELATANNPPIQQPAKKPVNKKSAHKERQKTFIPGLQKLGDISAIKDELGKLQFSISDTIALRNKEEEELFFLMAMALA